MKHRIVGEVRLKVEPGVEELPQRLKVQIIEGQYVTNIGWWLRMRGLEGKMVKITVEELKGG